MRRLCYFVFFLFAAEAAQKERRIHVTVYYETLCPDSVRFITKQLYPTWKDLRDYLAIEFVPFGKSWSDGLGNFKCQHGAEECKGNLIQSCALSMLEPWGPKEELVNCIMSSQNPTVEASSCAGTLGMSWSLIQNCMVDGTGAALQLKSERDTYNVQHGSISFVPTIVFNHRYNKQNQNDGLHNFRAVVCRLLAAPLPKACSNRRNFFGF